MATLTLKCLTGKGSIYVDGSQVTSGLGTHVIGLDEVPTGTSFVITVTPSDGCYFSHWIENNNINAFRIHQSFTYTVPSRKSNITYEACFFDAYDTFEFSVTKQNTSDTDSRIKLSHMNGYYTAGTILHLSKELFSNNDVSLSAEIYDGENYKFIKWNDNSRLSNRAYYNLSEDTHILYYSTNASIIQMTCSTITTISGCSEQSWDQYSNSILIDNMPIHGTFNSYVGDQFTLTAVCDSETAPILGDINLTSFTKWWDDSTINPRTIIVESGTSQELKATFNALKWPFFVMAYNNIESSITSDAIFIDYSYGQYKYICDIGSNATLYFENTNTSEGLHKFLNARKYNSTTWEEEIICRGYSGGESYQCIISMDTNDPSHLYIYAYFSDENDKVHITAGNYNDNFAVCYMELQDLNTGYTINNGGVTWTNLLEGDFYRGCELQGYATDFVSYVGTTEGQIWYVGDMYQSPTYLSNPFTTLINSDTEFNLNYWFNESYEFSASPYYGNDIITASINYSEYFDIDTFTIRVPRSLATSIRINQPAGYTVYGTRVTVSHPDYGTQVYNLPSTEFTLPDIHSSSGDNHENSEQISIELLTTPIQYNVTLNVSPIGVGTITGASTGLYNYGTRLYPVAQVSNPLYEFDGWYDANDVLIDTSTNFYIFVNDNLTYTAKFKKIKHTVNVIVHPQEGGTVTGAGEYEKGTTVTLIATPNTDYLFEGWYDLNGVIVSTESTYSFTILENKNLIAEFYKYAIITTTIDPSGAGTVIGAGTYHVGDEIYLEASANDGYEIKAWDSDGCVKIDQSTYGFYHKKIKCTVIKSGNVTAYFDTKYDLTLNVYPESCRQYLNLPTGTEIQKTLESNLGYWNLEYNYPTNLTQQTIGDLNISYYAIDENSSSISGTCTVNWESSGYYGTHPNKLSLTNIQSDIIVNLYCTLDTKNNWNVDCGSKCNVNYKYENYLDTEYGVRAYLSTKPSIGDKLIGWSIDGTPYYPSLLFSDLYDLRATNSDGSIGDLLSNLYDPILLAAGTVAVDKFNFIIDKEKYTPTGAIVLPWQLKVQPIYEYTEVTINAYSSSASQGHVDGGGTYAYNTTVTLTPVPERGYSFDYWERLVDDGSEIRYEKYYPTTVTSNGSFTISAVNDYTFIAHFKAIAHQFVVVNVSPTGSGEVSGAGFYYEGETVTLTATPNEHYVFDKYTNAATTFEWYTPTIIFKMPNDDVTINAYFERIYDDITPVQRNPLENQLYIAPGSDDLPIYKEPIADEFYTAPIVGTLRAPTESHLGSRCFYNVYPCVGTSTKMGVTEREYHYSSPCFVNDVRVKYEIHGANESQYIVPEISQYDEAEYFTSVQPHYNEETSTNNKIIWLCVYSNDGKYGWVKYVDDQFKARTLNEDETGYNEYIYLSKINPVLEEHHVTVTKESQQADIILHSGYINGDSGPCCWNKLLSPTTQTLTLDENTPCIIKPRKVDNEYEQQRWYTTRGFLEGETSEGNSSLPIYVYNNYLELSDSGIYETTITEVNDAGGRRTWEGSEEFYKAKFNASIPSGNYTVHSYCSGLMKVKVGPTENDVDYHTGMWVALRYNFATRKQNQVGYSTWENWNPYTHNADLWPVTDIPSGKWLDKRSNEQYSISDMGDYEHSTTGAALTANGQQLSLVNNSADSNSFYNDFGDYNLVYIFIDSNTEVPTLFQNKYNDIFDYIKNEKISLGCRDANKVHALQLKSVNNIYSSLYNLENNKVYSIVQSNNKKVLLSPFFNGFQGLCTLSYDSDGLLQVDDYGSNYDIEYTLPDYNTFEKYGYESRWRSGNVLTDVANFTLSTNVFEDDNNYCRYSSNENTDKATQVWSIIGSKINKNESYEYRQACICGHWGRFQQTGGYQYINYVSLNNSNVYKYDPIMWSTFYVKDEYDTSYKDNRNKEIWNYALAKHSINVCYSIFNDNDVQLPHAFNIKINYNNEDKITIFSTTSQSLEYTGDIIHTGRYFKYDNLSSNYSTNTIFVKTTNSGRDRTQRYCPYIPIKWTGPNDTSETPIAEQIYNQSIGIKPAVWGAYINPERISDNNILYTSVMLFATNISMNKDVYITFTGKPNSSITEGDYGTVIATICNEDGSEGYINTYVTAPEGWYFNGEIIALKPDFNYVLSYGEAQFNGWSINCESVSLQTIYYPGLHDTEYVYVVDSNKFGETQEIEGNFIYIKWEKTIVSTDTGVDATPKSASEQIRDLIDINNGTNQPQIRQDTGVSSSSSTSNVILNGVSYQLASTPYRSWLVQLDKSKPENVGYGVAKTILVVLYDDGTSKTFEVEGNYIWVSEEDLEGAKEININVIKYKEEKVFLTDFLYVYGTKTGTSEEYITNNIRVKMGISRDISGNILDGVTYSREFKYKYSLIIKDGEKGNDVITLNDIWPGEFDYNPSSSDKEVIQDLQLKDVLSKYVDQFKQNYLYCDVVVTTIDKEYEYSQHSYRYGMKIYLNGTQTKDRYAEYTTNVFRPNIEFRDTSEHNSLWCTNLFNDKAIAGFSNVNSDCYVYNVVSTPQGISNTFNNYVKFNNATFSSNSIILLDINNNMIKSSVKELIDKYTMRNHQLLAKSHLLMDNQDYEDINISSTVYDDIYERKMGGTPPTIGSITSAISNNIRVYGWTTPTVGITNVYRCNEAGQIMRNMDSNYCARIFFTINKSPIGGDNVVSVDLDDLRLIYDNINWAYTISGPSSTGVYSIIVGNSDHKLDPYSVYNVDFFLRDAVIKRFIGSTTYYHFPFKVNSIIPFSIRQSTSISDIGLGVGRIASEDNKALISLEVEFNNDRTMCYSGMIGGSEEQESTRNKYIYDLMQRGGERSVVSITKNESEEDIEYLNNFRLVDKTIYDPLDPEEKSKSSKSLFLTTDVPDTLDEQLDALAAGEI